MRQKELTLIPTKLYTKGRKIKVEFALAKSKREFEKRQVIKKKDTEREIAQVVRGKNI
jgi:SsrA-binding protein